jgi:hypothetical protein
MQVTTIGLDLAKTVFQVHGVDATGKVTVTKKLRRSQVLERLNRDGIVDEVRSRPYTPPNLPKDLPDELLPTGPDDKRVAQKTKREEELIDLCRKQNDNQRIQGCALFCDLKERPAASARDGSSPSRAVVAAPPARRAKKTPDKAALRELRR